jgi:23S rRNA (cytidine2498-2'-O)-methyltransferase
MSDFIFATCRAGSETALKREVAARHGDLLTPAFMRPQLITWKAHLPLDPAFELGAVFAAVSGRSLGMARTPDEVAAVVTGAGLAPTRLHVFPRLVSEDGLEPAIWAQMDAVAADIQRVLPAIASEPSHDDDQVLDVIVGEDKDAWFIGTHRHSIGSHPCPGAISRAVLQPAAPSRAWLKMEQALSWLELDKPGSLDGKVVLELGCAPGGASYSLLQRGAEVIGVDTGAMDERVLNFAGPKGAKFTHLSTSAAELLKTTLPQHVDILVSDMNLEPSLVLKYVEALCYSLEPRLLFLTFKLNTADVERQLPELTRRLQTFAPRPLRAKQLHANRRDVCVIAGNLR